MSNSLLCSTRFVVLCLSNFGLILVYAMRTNLSVAIDSMTGPSNISYSNISDCPVNKNMSYVKPNKSNDLNWNAAVQSYILMAFFAGYVSTQIPGGYLAERYGGKWVFGLGILVTTILTLISPLTVDNVEVFIAVRVFEGVGEGVTFPALVCLITQWTSLNEQNFAFAFVFSGSTMGTIISNIVTGWICDNWNWQWSFYIWGIIGTAWFVVWGIMVSSHPAHSYLISDEELLFLSQTTIHKDAGRSRDTPWLSILLSPTVWMNCLSSLGSSCLLYVGLTEMPSYFEKVLHVSATESGFLNGLPYIFSFISTILMGMLVDKIGLHYSLAITRRLVFTICSVLSAIFFSLIYFAGCDPIMATILACFALSFSSCASLNVAPNISLVFPCCASVIYGIVNMFSNTMGLAAPYITGIFTENDESSLQSWSYVYYISSVITILSAISFLFASPRKSPAWAVLSYNSEASSLFSTGSRDPPEFPNHA